MGLVSKLKDKIGRFAVDKLMDFDNKLMWMTLDKYKQNLMKFNGSPNSEEIRCEQLHAQLKMGLMTSAEKTELLGLCEKYPTKYNKLVQKHIDLYKLKDLHVLSNMRARDFMLIQIAEINHKLGIVPSEINHTQDKTATKSPLDTWVAPDSTGSGTINTTDENAAAKIHPSEAPSKETPPERDKSY